MDSILTEVPGALSNYTTALIFEGIGTGWSSFLHLLITLLVSILLNDE